MSERFQRILLLNPPAEQLVIRDNYCSYTSKADYCWPPIDLLAQSGVLTGKHHLEALDCNVLRLDFEESRRRVDALSFDVVLSMVGLVSLREDLRFLKEISRSRPEARIFVSGDIVPEQAELLLERYPFLAGALSDYSSLDLRDWILGERRSFAQLAWRDGGRVIARSEADRFSHFDYPVPRHDLFSSTRYRLSIGRCGSFATVITSMGCNFACPFCVMSTSRLGSRDLDGLFRELSHVRSLAIPEVYFYDPNFTSSPSRVREICRRIIEGDYRFQWLANGQVACLDEETIAAMARAGCHTLMLGLESGNDGILRRYRKGFDTSRAREVVRLLAEHGIRSFGYFLFGLPGETTASMRETVDFAIDLDLDYVSFSSFIPLPGTPMCSVDGLQDTSDFELGPCPNRSGSSASDARGGPKAREIVEIKREAYRRFYLRPGYILRRIRDLDSSALAARGLVSALYLAMKQLR